MDPNKSSVFISIGWFSLTTHQCCPRPGTRFLSAGVQPGNVGAAQKFQEGPMGRAIGVPGRYQVTGCFNLSSHIQMENTRENTHEMIDV